MKNLINKIIAVCMLVSVSAVGLTVIGLTATVSMWSSTVEAHGERAQEPFLRMRTIQWYDIEWSKRSIAVNERMEVTGKFRVAPAWSWPASTAKPDLAFLNISSPGPVFVRKGSWVNGHNMANSAGFELGRDYEFKVILMGRYPGDWHVHSMLNVKDAGPIVGPGNYVEVTGDHADFVNEITTLTGETVDMNTYGTAHNVRVHLLWGLFGVIWLGWWLVKPLFFSRYAMVAAGRGDELNGKADKIFSAVMLVLAISFTGYGYSYADAKWPVTLPLQSSQIQIEPLPLDPQQVSVKLAAAEYRVPGRSMKMELKVTNNTDTPVRLGEFNTATVRFINPKIGFMDRSSRNWPDYLMAENGLTVEDNTPIMPGETRIIKVEAADAAWETERLSTLIYDPDSRFGGLLFFYDANGKRHIADVGGVLVPRFI